MNTEPYKCLFIGGPLHRQVKPISNMRPHYTHSAAGVETVYENHALLEPLTKRRYLLFVHGPMPSIQALVDLIRERNLPSIHAAPEPENA